MNRNLVTARRGVRALPFLHRFMAPVQFKKEQAAFHEKLGVGYARHLAPE